MSQIFIGVETARDYAVKCHADVNHRYGKHPYSVHLSMVKEIAESYLHLIPKESWEDVLKACWCHDVIEDTRQTYNDVVAVIGENAAEIVYAVTNEKGKTRKERANEKYYQGILATPHANFVKICDRLANISYSRSENSSILAKYSAEHDEFKAYLYRPEYKEMFDQMETTLDV